MMDMILDFALLNIPESILIVCLCFSSIPLKNNYRKYISATLSSALVLYIVPELFPFIPVSTPYMIFVIPFLFKYSYGIEYKRALTCTIVAFAIAFIAQLPLMLMISKFIGLDDYHSFSSIDRFIILIPFVISEISIILHVRRKI